MSRTKFAARTGRGLATMVYIHIGAVSSSFRHCHRSHQLSHMSRLSENFDNKVIRNASNNRLSTMLCRGPVWLKEIQQHWLARLYSMYKFK
jgi:hypothetical protein